MDFMDNVLHFTDYFQIDEIYYIGGVGVIAGGTLLRGTIKEADSLLVGPTDDGEFVKCSVQSLHRNRMPCRTVIAGQAACVSLGQFDGCHLRRVSKIYQIIDYIMCSSTPHSQTSPWTPA